MTTLNNKTIFFSTLLLLLAGILAFALFGAETATAQAQPQQPVLPPRTITVVGMGSVNMEPDVAHTNIGVQVTHEDIKVASNKAEKAMDAVLAALLELGIDKKDIQTSGYSIYQERAPEMYGMLGAPGTGKTSEPVAAYFVNSSLSVVIRDVELVGDVLAVAIEAGANSIHGVRFSADDPKAVMAEARQLAAKDARARAEELAALHGVNIGEVISVSEVIGGFGAPMMLEKAMAYGGGGGGGIAPGELEVSAQLQVVYAIESDATMSRHLAPSTAETESKAVITVVVQPKEDQDDDSAPVPTPRPGVVTEVVVEKAVVAAPAMPGPPAKLHIVGEDEDLLRTFVERWLARSHYSMPGTTPTDQQLLLGQLPDNLPFEIALPENITVIGSLVQGAPMGTQILLDAAPPVEDAVAELSAAFEAQGLSTPETPMTHGNVFGSLMPGPLPTIYCDPDNDYFVTVTAADIDEDTADIRISYQEPEQRLGVYSPCNLPDSAMMGPNFDILPQLQAPKGVFVHRSGGGSGEGGNVYRSADMQTELSVAELAEHYHAQLQDAGWALVDTSQVEAVSWSVWDFTDDKGNDWIGTLLLTDKMRAEDARFALLRAEHADK